MWLYVPGLPETSYPYAQASEDLNSEYTLPCNIGERLAEASVMWRSKPAHPAAWSRRWKRVGWIKRLSGLTCEHSTLNHGVELWIFSLREIPARTIPSLGKAREKMDKGSLLPKSVELPPSAGLLPSSARTCRGTPTDSSRHSFRLWKGWATALRAEYSRRPKPVTPCGESDCSSWPSAKTVSGGWERDRNGWAAPTALDTNGPGVHGDGGTDLRTQVATWSAPKSSDAEKGGPNMSYSKGDTLPLPSQAAQWEAPSVAVTEGSRMTRGGERSDELLLTGQAMEASGRLAGPAAQNHKGSSECSIIRADGKSREDILSYQAEQFFRLPSSPDQQIAGGSMSSTDSLNSNQPSVKRKLNPIFVEALMRWPTGLSGFERQETAWTRWWQLMPSYLSVLCSRKPDSQTSLFD